MFTKPVVSKIAIGVMGAGGLGVAGYQGYQILNKEEETTVDKVSNSKQLENEKYVPLTEDATNDTHWNTILGSYKTSDSKLRFEGFDGQEPEGGTPKAVDILKAKCKEALESENSALLTKARKWCVTPVKATDLLTNRGKKVLKTDAGQPQEEIDQWKERIKEFEVAKKIKSELGTLITLQTGDNHEATNIVEIKNKCKAFGQSVSHAKEFEKNLENLGEWCVNKP